MKRPPTVEEYRETRKADRLVREMDRHEPLAMQSESHADLNTRLFFARKYRELIGVEPSQRHALRAECAAIRDRGGLTLAEILRLFSHQSRLASSSAVSRPDPFFS